MHAYWLPEAQEVTEEAARYASGLPWLTRHYSSLPGVVGLGAKLIAEKLAFSDGTFVHLTYHKPGCQGINGSSCPKAMSREYPHPSRSNV